MPALVFAFALFLMTALSGLLRAARRVQARVENNPLRWVRWTKPQRLFHQLQAKRKLFRAGNQIGKSWAGLAEAIWIGAKCHPYQAPRPGPLEIWIVCTSWSQSVAIMRKFHDLCPPEYIDARASSNFSFRNGYGKDNPAVIFLDGTVYRFRTTNQGPTALQGATIDHVHIDEPTDIDIYRELDRRVMRTGGTISITATPVNRDCTWLREMVEQGKIEEVHARMEAANFIPEGANDPLYLLDGTPMDQAWIDEQRRNTPAIFAPVVLDGEWDMRPEGVVFEKFDKGRHVSATARLNPQRGPVRWALGIDYSAADRDFGQVAVLAQVQQQTDEHGRKHEAVLVVDSVVMPGIATNTQFADRVLDMLERQGLRWRDVYRVHGDNPVRSRFGIKSNIETMRAIAKRLGVAARSLQPRVRKAKDQTASAGTVTAGVRYLHVAMVERRFAIHPRNKLLIEAFETWDFDPKHPAKDRIDALRYALKPWIFPYGATRGPQLRVG